MRAGVGHLTRNIKIVRGADPDGWGFRVLTYESVLVISTVFNSLKAANMIPTMLL
jgi:hypothetical protein